MLALVAFIVFIVYSSWYASQVVYSDKRYLFYAKAEAAREQSYVTLYDRLGDVVPPEIYKDYIPFLKDNAPARFDRVVVLQKHEKTRYPRGDITGYVLAIIYVRDSTILSYDFGEERDGREGDVVAYYTEGVTHYGHLVCVGYASAGAIAIQEISPERIRVQANLKFSPADHVPGRHLRCEDSGIQVDEEFEFAGRYGEIR